MYKYGKLIPITDHKYAYRVSNCGTCRITFDGDTTKRCPHAKTVKRCGGLTFTFRVECTKED